MKLNLTLDNVTVTLESNDKNAVMALLDKIMTPSARPEPSSSYNIRTEMRQHLSTVIPPQTTTVPETLPTQMFIPASDKQKSLLRNIPEYKGKDLTGISKSEASMAIEKWNKSRSYHYKDHY